MKSKEFRQQLAAYVESLRQKIEAQFDGWDDSPQAVAARRKQVLDPVSGLEFFINHYFPHYVRSSSKSQLHHYLFNRLPQVFSAEKGCLEAIAAPRGEAKSTIVTQLSSLWCLVTQQKRYILLVMDSIDQAYPMLEAIKSELEFNQRLRIDFPEIAGAEQYRSELIKHIDDTAAEIAAHWTRFAEEYKAREEAALAYQAANFEGEPSIYITSFSSVAGLDDKSATLLILQQAAGLRHLQEQLAVQRMRKYELKKPNLTIEQMQELHDDIINQMYQLAETAQ